MSAVRDKKIIADLSALDLSQLRTRYTEIYGEQSKGGAEFLRKKIALALMRQDDAEQLERTVDEELSSGTSEAVADRHGAEALTAESDGEFAKAAGLWAKAAAASAKYKDGYQDRAAKARKEALRLGQIAVAAAVEAVAKAPRPLFGGKRRPPEQTGPAPVDLPTEEDKRRQFVTMTRRAAEESEAKGNLSMAAKAWEELAVFDPASAEVAMARATDLRIMVASLELPKKPVAIEELVSDPTREKLLAVAIGEASNKTTLVHRDRRIPQVGTTFGRKYNGNEFKVTVMADGFLLNDDNSSVVAPVPRRFKTLSEAASCIANRKVSGFKFFGLNDELAPGDSAADGTPVTVPVPNPPLAKKPRVVVPHSFLDWEQQAKWLSRELDVVRGQYAEDELLYERRSAELKASIAERDLMQQRLALRVDTVRKELPEADVVPAPVWDGTPPEIARARREARKLISDLDGYMRFVSKKLKRLEQLIEGDEEEEYNGE